MDWSQESETIGTPTEQGFMGKMSGAFKIFMKEEPE